VLLHLWIGGLGGYALARRHNLSQGAALAAAFVYMLSGPSISRAIGHWYFHFALAWVPWLFCCAHCALNATDVTVRRRAVMLAGLVYGLILLAGTPHFMVLSGFLLAWFWLLWRIAAFAVERDRRLGRFGGILALDAVRLAAIAVIGAFVAAPLLFPAFELSQFSARAASDVAVEHIERTGPLWNLWQLLAIYSGDTTYEGLRASGAIALILAFTALASARRREVVVWAALFLIALDCSLDNPVLFGRIFTAISPYPISSPPRGMLLAVLPLGMLAAFGIDALTEAAASRRQRIALSAIAAAAALAVAATVWQAVTPHPYLEVGLAVVFLPAAAIAAAIALRWKPLPFFGAIFIAMLILGETLFWNRAMLPYWLKEDLQYPKATDSLHGERQFWATNSRGTDKNPNSLLYNLEPAINGYDPLHLAAIADLMGYGTLTNHFRRIFFFDEPTAHSFHGNLFLKRQFWLTRQYVDGPLPGRDEIFPATTTVFIDDPAILPVKRVDAVHQQGKAVSRDAVKRPLMPKNGQALIIDAPEPGDGTKALTLGPLTPPAVHTALALTVESTAMAKLNPMCLDPDTGAQELGKILPVIPTEKGQAIYFEIPLPDFSKLEMAITAEFTHGEGQLRFTDMHLLEDVADEGAQITVLSRSANRVRIRLDDLAGPRILLNADAWYPGWKAYIDGKLTPIIKANDAFKAVAVPPGTHEVEFVFRSRLVTMGLVTSALSLALASLYLAWPIRRRVKVPRRK
jgi:hypothetical protein